MIEARLRHRTTTRAWHYLAPPGKSKPRQGETRFTIGGNEISTRGGAPPPPAQSIQSMDQNIRLTLGEDFACPTCHFRVNMS